MTFIFSAETMLSSVSKEIDKLERRQLDVHTVTLVLNGQHGEFDLTILADDERGESHKFDGIAHRMGGVTSTLVAP